MADEVGASPGVMGTVLGAVAGAVWAAGTWWIDYQARASAAQTTAKRESQRPFLEKQLQLYFETARVTAKLATLPLGLSDKGPGSEESWDWAHRRFWELYWGELAVVESREVAGAMVAFGEQLRSVKACIMQPSPACKAQQDTLQQLSLELTARMRESIERGWDYSLPPLISK